MDCNPLRGFKLKRLLNRDFSNFQAVSVRNSRIGGGIQKKEKKTANWVLPVGR
jgi:hypothetical protein